MQMAISTRFIHYVIFVLCNFVKVKVFIVLKQSLEFVSLASSCAGQFKVKIASVLQCRCVLKPFASYLEQVVKIGQGKGQHNQMIVLDVQFLQVLESVYLVQAFQSIVADVKYLQVDQSEQTRRQVGQPVVF
jgi:hypothetical protein